jgi:hypothetical protein
VDILSRILILYTCTGTSALLIVLYRIARFYQITAKERSYYQAFLVPLALFVLSGLRYAQLADFVGDPLGDGLLMLAGGSLFVVGYYLLNLMMGGRQ